MGGILGGILGGGSSPGQQAQMQGIKGSVQDYQTYRQEMAQALLNTLNTANSSYQGANNGLATLYGAPATHSNGSAPPAVWSQAAAHRASAQAPQHTAASPQIGAPTGSPMGNAPHHQSQPDPFLTAAGAVFDPAGVFTKGIGGLF